MAEALKLSPCFSYSLHNYSSRRKYSSRRIKEGISLNSFNGLKALAGFPLRTPSIQGFIANDLLLRKASVSTSTSVRGRTPIVSMAADGQYYCLCLLVLVAIFLLGFHRNDCVHCCYPLIP